MGSVFDWQQDCKIVKCVFGKSAGLDGMPAGCVCVSERAGRAPLHGDSDGAECRPERERDTIQPSFGSQSAFSTQHRCPEKHQNERTICLGIQVRRHCYDINSVC